MKTLSFGPMFALFLTFTILIIIGLWFFYSSKISKVIEEKQPDDTFDIWDEIDAIENFFKQRNISEREDENIDELIRQSGIAKQFEKLETISIWDYNNDICIIIVTPTTFTGEFDYELMIAVKTNSAYRYSQLSTMFKDNESEHLGEWLIIRIPKSVRFNDFKNIIDQLEA